MRHGRVANVLAMLSRVRGDSLRDYDIGELAGHLWDLADAEMRTAIRAILATQQAGEIRAIPVLLGGGTSTKLAGDSDLLVAIVEGAFDCGYEIGSEVNGALKRALLFIVRDFHSIFLAGLPAHDRGRHTRYRVPPHRSEHAVFSHSALTLSG